MTKHFFVFPLILAFNCLIRLWAQSAPPLDDQRILNLLRSGVHPDELIRLISAAPQVSFDLTPAGTEAMLKAGISEDVIKAMAARKSRAPIRADVPATSAKTAKKPPHVRINEMVISASCDAVWVTVLQAVHAPLQLRASDKEAGVLDFVSTSRFSDAESNEAVRTLTTARLSRVPGTWSNFGIDAMNFILKPVGDQSCSVHMDMAYSATSRWVSGMLPLHTNGAAETAFLTELRDAAKQGAYSPR
jgi:hypothetical protein